MTDQYPRPSALHFPLAVDLDGTLIQGDVTLLMLWHVFWHTPWRLPLVAWWHLTGGRPRVKRRLAESVPLDVHTLTYDTPLVAWLGGLKNQGVSLILITGSDENVARKIADYLGIFDLFIGSDGLTNRIGTKKVAWLNAHYGAGQYGYLGNSRSDLPVWASAGQALAVNVSESVWRRLKRLKPDALRLPPFSAG